MAVQAMRPYFTHEDYARMAEAGIGRDDPLLGRRFTVADYHRLAELGFFGECPEDEPVELIEGEIVVMGAVGNAHVWSVNAYNETLMSIPDRTWTVSIQNPIRLSDDSEPEPDVVLIPRGYPGGTPHAADVPLVIEVADTTLRSDRRVKVPLYAASGIPEVWITDLRGGRIARYSDLRDGRYQVVTHARRGETMTSLVLPTISIPVDAVIPAPR